VANNVMAHPELRHPFEKAPLHPPGAATVLYQGRSVTLTRVAEGPGLKIDPEDLPRVNGFELKAEGACYEALCVPVDDRLLVEAEGRRWFDLEAFAERMDQPYVKDEEARVWSFAELPAKRENTLLGAMAPELELTDRSGKVFRLADLKGKKALIVTWSSW